MTLQVRDLGWGRIIQELKQMDNSFVKVGYPEEGKPKSGNKGSGREQLSSISEIAFIASIHEFGSRDGHTPERATLRTAFDENIEKINQMKFKLYVKIVNGKITNEAALKILGEYIVNLTKKKIVELDSPPNKQSTIRKKGSENPLIDTAQMLNSVQSVVKI
jgi:hypothetical protein